MDNGLSDVCSMATVLLDPVIVFPPNRPTGLCFIKQSFSIDSGGFAGYDADKLCNTTNTVAMMKGTMMKGDMVMNKL